MRIERDSGLCRAPESELEHEIVRLRFRAGLTFGQLERDRPDLLCALFEAGMRPEQVRELLAS